MESLLIRVAVKNFVQLSILVCEPDVKSMDLCFETRNQLLPQSVRFPEVIFIFDQILIIKREF